MPDLLPPFLLSLRVAAIALCVALPIGILAAWWFSRIRNRWIHTILETLLTLPLVLPPSAVGVGLLFLLGRSSALGQYLIDKLHIRLVFTWQAAVIASAIVSLPLIVRTVQASLSSVERDLTDAARIEGAKEWIVLYRILLPLSYRGVLAAATLGFARAFSEFGATLLVAGATPGETETLPLALYAAMDRGDSTTAIRFTFLAILVGFVLLFLANLIMARIGQARGEVTG